jgi:hypothetical protein
MELIKRLKVLTTTRLGESQYRYTIRKHPINFDEKDIAVDDYCKTNVDGVFCDRRLQR